MKEKHDKLLIRVLAVLLIITFSILSMQKVVAPLADTTEETTASTIEEGTTEEVTASTTDVTTEEVIDASTAESSEEKPVSSKEDSESKDSSSKSEEDSREESSGSKDNSSKDSSSESSEYTGVNPEETAGMTADRENAKALEKAIDSLVNDAEEYVDSIMGQTVYGDYTKKKVYIADDTSKYPAKSVKPNDSNDDGHKIFNAIKNPDITIDKIKANGGYYTKCLGSNGTKGTKKSGNIAEKWYGMDTNYDHKSEYIKEGFNDNKGNHHAACHFVNHYRQTYQVYADTYTYTVTNDSAQTVISYVVTYVYWEKVGELKEIESLMTYCIEYNAAIDRNAAKEKEAELWESVGRDKQKLLLKVMYYGPHLGGDRSTYYVERTTTLDAWNKNNGDKVRDVVATDPSTWVPTFAKRYVATQLYIWTITTDGAFSYDDALKTADIVDKECILSDATSTTTKSFLEEIHRYVTKASKLPSKLKEKKEQAKTYTMKLTSGGKDYAYNLSDSNGVSKPGEYGTWTIEGAVPDGFRFSTKSDAGKLRILCDATKAVPGTTVTVKYTSKEKVPDRNESGAWAYVSKDTQNMTYASIPPTDLSGYVKFKIATDLTTMPDLTVNKVNGAGAGVSGAVFKWEFYDGIQTVDNATLNAAIAGGTAGNAYTYYTMTGFDVNGDGAIDAAEAGYTAFNAVCLNNAGALGYASDELQYKADGVTLGFPAGTMRVTEVYAPDPYVVPSEDETRVLMQFTPNASNTALDKYTSGNANIGVAAANAYAAIGSTIVEAQLCSITAYKQGLILQGYNDAQGFVYNTGALPGVSFGLYTDMGVTPALNADGNVAQGVTGPDGVISFTRLRPGTYYLYELSSPAQYTDKNYCGAWSVDGKTTVDLSYATTTSLVINNDRIPLNLGARKLDATDNKLVINGANPALAAQFKLTTATDVMEFSTARVAAGTVVGRGSADENGNVVFVTKQTVDGVTAETTNFPVSTYFAEETLAPYGYALSSEDVTLTPDSNSGDFHNTPVRVDLQITKQNVEDSPAQGNTGDVSLEGAVYAIYAKRDVLSGTGTVIQHASTTYSEKTPYTFSDGSFVKDAYGNIVYAESGDLVPLYVYNPTTTDGKTEVSIELPAAQNEDDYFVRELTAPWGFKRDTSDIAVDLRTSEDSRTKAELIEHKTLAHKDTPLKQPVEIYKVIAEENDKGDIEMERLSGIKFKIYLVSALKNLDNAITSQNANGSYNYDFSEYDFTDEVAINAAKDGGTELVTGSDGHSRGFVQSIPLYFGKYVLVETEHPEGVDPIKPIVFDVPEYKGIDTGLTEYQILVKFDANRDPILEDYYLLDIANQATKRYIKINKKDEEDEYVLHNNAKFTIWEIPKGVDAGDLVDEEAVKAKCVPVKQKRQTDRGYEYYTEFYTNEEGFLLLYDYFTSGKYVILEEEAPVGYAKSAPIIFSVDADITEFYYNGNWIKCTVWKDAVDRTYYEVTVVDVDYELSLAKVDAETGDYVPEAEYTIYKALNANGDLALDENGNPSVLEAEVDGKEVPAVWTTTAGFKKFEVVPAGWYLIKETKRPKGYATAKDVVVYVGNNPDVAPDGYRVVTGDDTIYYSFTERYGGVDILSVDSVNVNTIKESVILLDKPITVDISKIDEATEKELPGAELTLYHVVNGTDTVVETWVSTDKSHVIKYLEPGHYKLHENTVPLGFYSEPNTIEFDVTDTMDVQKHKMINHPTRVEFYKKSATTDKMVTGAKLALYRTSAGAFNVHDDGTGEKDANGNRLVERWVTDGSVHVITNLYPGTYKLVEEETPYGYTTSGEVVFEVTDTQPVPPVIMYDELIECRIQIHKTGEVLTKATKATCEYGDYTEFKWEDANLEGVQFDVFNEDGALVQTLTTDASGMAYSDKLAFGKYTIKEHVPAGYVDNDVVYTIEYTWLYGMTDKNLTGNLSVYNESCNTQVNVYKVGEIPYLDTGSQEYEYVNEPLEGVLFGIYAEEDVVDYYGKKIAKKDTCVGYAVTDSNGVATFDTKLIKGKYYYKELKTAGPEFVIDEDTHSFELILENEKLDVFNLNAEDPVVNEAVKGYIRVYKITSNGKSPLSGAVFAVFNSDDEQVAELTTDSSGYAETGELPYGKYYLREIKAPSGYQKVNTKFKAKVLLNDEVTTVTIENGKTPKLGTSGAVVIAGLAAILAGLVVTAGAILRRRRR